MRGMAAWITWRGRLHRGGFLWRGALAAAVFVVMYVFMQHAFNEAGTLILYPFFFAVMLSLAVRRLHDQARAAWWLLALLIPVLGPLLIAVLLLFHRGSDGQNQYGEDPRDAGRDYLQVRIHEPA